MHKNRLSLVTKYRKAKYFDDCIGLCQNILELAQSHSDPEMTTFKNAFCSMSRDPANVVLMAKWLNSRGAE